MSKSWPKEDAAAWSRSEVFQNFEKSIAENFVRLSTIQQRIEKNAQDKLSGALEKVKTLNTELQKAKTTVEQVGLADDAKDFVQKDDLMFHQDNPYAENNNEEWEEDEIEDHIIKDLKAMAQEAITEGNIKLAYKIERTIQEIMDKE